MITHHIARVTPVDLRENAAQHRGGLHLGDGGVARHQAGKGVKLGVLDIHKEKARRLGGQVAGDCGAEIGINLAHHSQNRQAKAQR